MMDDRRIDRIASGPGDRCTRRSLLGLFGGGLFGAASAAGAAAAKPAKGKRHSKPAPAAGRADAPGRTPCGEGCCPRGYSCCNALDGICVRAGQTCGQ